MSVTIDRDDPNWKKVNAVFLLGATFSGSIGAWVGHHASEAGADALTAILVGTAVVGVLFFTTAVIDSIKAVVNDE